MRKLAVALLLGNQVFFRASTKITLQRPCEFPIFTSMMYHASHSLDRVTHRSQRSLRKKVLKFGSLIAVTGIFIYILKMCEKPIATCSKKSLQTSHQVSETSLSESKQTLDRQTTENFSLDSPPEVCNECSTHSCPCPIDSKTHRQDKFLGTPFSERKTEELLSDQSSEIFEETIAKEYDSCKNDPYQEAKIKNCISSDKELSELSQFISFYKLSDKKQAILNKEIKQIASLIITQPTSPDLEHCLELASAIIFNHPIIGYSLIESIILHDKIPHTIFSILFSKEGINWNNRSNKGTSFFELALKTYGETTAATKKEKLKWILLHFITDSQVNLELRDIKSCENGLKILKTEVWIQKALKEREDFASFPEYIQSLQYAERLDVQKNLDLKQPLNSEQPSNHIENVPLIGTFEADNPVLLKKRNVKDRQPY